MHSNKTHPALFLQPVQLDHYTEDILYWDDRHHNRGEPLYYGFNLLNQGAEGFSDARRQSMSSILGARFNDDIILFIPCVCPACRAIVTSLRNDG